MKLQTATSDAYLKVENLVVSYFKKEILFGVSLDVCKGEIVTLIGANGSGKSTLLKTIAGTIAARSGHVQFDGREITGKDPSELVRRKIGFLMQGGQIFPSLTVYEHLQLATHLLEKSKVGERLEKVWNTFPSLYTLREKRAGLLSGGERQLLAFSMLLAQNCRLWLLDEPSSGLALPMVKALIDCIAKCNAEEGVTVLIAEQNLVEGLRIAHRVFVIKNGLAHSEENPQELLNRDRLEKIFFN